MLRSKDSEHREPLKGVPRTQKVVEEACAVTIRNLELSSSRTGITVFSGLLTLAVQGMRYTTVSKYKGKQRPSLASPSTCDQMVFRLVHSAKLHTEVFWDRLLVCQS